MFGLTTDVGMIRANNEDSHTLSCRSAAQRMLFQNSASLSLPMAWAVTSTAN